MKRFKIRKVLSLLFTFTLLLSISILSVTSQFKYDYEKPILLGAEIDLIDEKKYYAGAYWDGEAYLLDEKGERLLDEKGKPFKNPDRNLHILVTDLKVVPKEINNPKLFFDEVKYSETELLNFIDLILENFAYKGLVGVGLKTLENKYRNNSNK